MKKTEQKLEDISSGDQSNPVADFISRFGEIKTVTTYDEKTTKLTPTYLAQMCLLDTFSVMAAIMTPAENNADLLAARAIALAGKNRLNVLILDKGEGKSIKWATQSKYPYSLATTLAHGSGITFNYNQELQDKLCPDQSVLKTQVLKGVDFNSTMVSTHQHIYDYEEDRVIDAKTGIQNIKNFKSLISPSDRIDSEQVRINFGEGVPFLNGMISTGGGYFKRSFGAWLCVGSNPTPSRSGAFTMGLETSAILTKSLTGHIHLTGSASDTNLFLTGPKVNVLIPLLLKDGPIPKAKRDSLCVHLDAQSEELEILKMGDFELKKYAVGMLLGMDRAVNDKEYKDIFEKIMVPLPDMISGINEQQFLQSSLAVICDGIHKGKNLKTATPLKDPEQAIIILHYDLIQLESSMSSFGQFWYKQEISALKKFVHLVQYEAKQITEKSNKLTKSEFDQLTKSLILTPIINRFVQNNGNLPQSYIDQRQLIADYESDSSLMF
jgi:hypothetical protein